MAPGPGWGGSCLPKDTEAMLQVADFADYEFRLLRATIDTNTRQRQRMVDKVRHAITGQRGGSLSHTRIAILGLTFKAGTDDLRDSPALAVAALLHQAGADLVGYDPALPNPTHRPELAALSVVDDPYLAAKDAHAIVILTEWPEFRTLDWAKLATVVSRPIVVDLRNLLDADTLHRAGFTWTGLGKRPKRS
jgi:UDPglucose 6-dehydrogenase